MTGPSITNDALIAEASAVDMSDSDALSVAQAVSAKFGQVVSDLQAAQSQLASAQAFAADDTTRQSIEQSLTNALNTAKQTKEVLDALVAPPSAAKRGKGK